MKLQRGWHSLVAAGLLLGACTSKAEEKAPAPASPPSTEQAPSNAAPAQTDETKSTDQEPVSLNWKDERKAKALAGLTYASGRVEIDPAAAATKVTVQDPALAESMHATAREQLARNEVIEAIDSFTRAVLLAPNQAQHYSGLADALLAKRMVKEALAALRVAVELEPSSGALHFQLGDAFVRANDRPAAIGELQKSLELDPSNAIAHERLALQLYYLEDYAGAWQAVHACEALGGAVPPQFRVLLVQAAVEPANK
ncbi:MAG: hypothetical protein HZA52_20805 [Planctomycetes bacterium]|nr:hypothetical protein [Planctomycetota bacterium]